MGYTGNTTGTITINKGTPSLTLTTTPSASFAYNGTPIKASYGISTYLNQLSANFYLNKALIATTATSGNYVSSAAAGT
ncbi:MAG: hypothetical protein ACP5MB_11345, partial [bacterium]